MQTITTFIRNVPEPRNGRFEVWCVGGPRAYTFDAWKASLCKRAGTINRAVTITYTDTEWGRKIQTVELVPEPQERVA